MTDLMKMPIAFCTSGVILNKDTQLRAQLFIPLGGFAFQQGPEF